MTLDWEQEFAELSESLGRLRFGKPVDVIYNPLEYARQPLLQYCNRFGKSPKKILFLGMNPGPFGMVQTGIPFGEVQAVRDYLRIDAPIGSPAVQHPRRPVEGYACRRSEVSGRRLWGWIRTMHPDPETFFEHSFVFNYCPLAFVSDSGRNITPEQLGGPVVDSLYRLCDAALLALVRRLEVEWVVGVGQFAARRAQMALSPHVPVRVGAILHPSPANPAANRDWARTASTQMEALGLDMKTQTHSP